MSNSTDKTFTPYKNVRAVSWTQHDTDRKDHGSADALSASILDNIANAAVVLTIPAPSNAPYAWAVTVNAGSPAIFAIGASDGIVSIDDNSAVVASETPLALTITATATISGDTVVETFNVSVLVSAA